MTDTTETKRAQVAAQCKVVAHLARALAHVHGDKAKMFEAGCCDDLIEWIGNNTAAYMEKLGDILNGMDAIDEEQDAWTHPVFEDAHRLWPQKREGVTLWCCHVRGPDDVHAAPDYATALAWSDRFNDWCRKQEKRDGRDPVMRAAPAIWPWSVESHAESLPRCLEQFADGKLP